MRPAVERGDRERDRTTHPNFRSPPRFGRPGGNSGPSDKPCAQSSTRRCARHRTPRWSPPDRPAQNRHRCAAGPSQKSGSCTRPRRSPPAPRQNPPAHGRDRAAAVRTPRDVVAGAPAHSPLRSLDGFDVAIHGGEVRAYHYDRDVLPPASRHTVMSLGHWLSRKAWWPAAPISPWRLPRAPGCLHRLRSRAPLSWASSPMACRWCCLSSLYATWEAGERAPISRRRHSSARRWP